MIPAHRHQGGFGAIAAIVVLVLLALFAAALVTMGSVQHVAIAQDVLAARAWQAARAGNEWGVFQALRQIKWPGDTGQRCDLARQRTTLNLIDATGFNVTVTCDAWRYNEGETPQGNAISVIIYRVVAVACPAATCPDTTAAAAAPGYVERTRTVLVSN